MSQRPEDAGTDQPVRHDDPTSPEPDSKVALWVMLGLGVALGLLILLGYATNP